MGKAKALVVDDEAALREALREELVIEAWTVAEAADGIEALRQMEKERFDVVISDIRMPSMDGWTLLRKVREHDVETVFVVMSAYADTPPWEAYALGADAFFGKPFRISDLEELLRRMRRPPLERWGEAELDANQWTPAQHIDVDCRRHPENFSLGRGGMFVSSEMQGVRRGTVLEFHVTTPEFTLEGMGIVRWKRGPGEGDLIPGLGVEFLYLKESCRNRIAAAIAKAREKSFIPRGMAAKA